MRTLIYLLTILFLTSCSASYHLNRAKYHILKAESLGATINKDTIYKEIVTKPTIAKGETKYETLKELLHDTINIETTRWKSKTVIDTVTKTIYQQVECLPDTIKVPVSVATNIKASTGYSLFQIIIYTIAGLAVGYVLRAIFK